MSMKKLLILFLVIATALSHGSCGINNPSQKLDLSTDRLKEAVDSVSPIKSIYYIVNYEEVLETDEGIETTISIKEEKVLKDPFSMWTKTVTAPNGIWEQYNRATEKGFETSIRGEGTEWQTNPLMDPIHTQELIDFYEGLILVKFYLLRENLDSFRMENHQDGLIQYGGTISQSSVVEAYRVYFRDFFIHSNLIKPEQEIPDDLLKEITDGQIDALLVGLPSLAFAEKGIPVTVWINEEDNTIVKVEVDKTDAIQALYDRDIRGVQSDVTRVEKSVETYEVIEINTFDELPMPQLEGYTYPVLPGSDEWRTFKTAHEMIEACQIPEELLTIMTTEALTQTVLDYPLIMDLLVAASDRHGFEVMLSQFNGLQELSRRVDARDALEAQYLAISETNKLQGESSIPENEIREILIGILIEQPEFGKPNEK